MRPSVLRQGDKLQLSYDLPHRVFDTKIYPCQSPNGSSIILYGHEAGLRILWYGGRPFKSSEFAEQPPKVNGASKDDMLVIDLDDDEPQTAQSAPRAEFEDEDLEVDPSEPYRNIVRHIDIPFGTSAMHLATPNITSDIIQSAHGAYPPILSTHIVVAAACGDFSVRLITLPLVMPAPSSTGSKGESIQIAKILGSNTHQDLISSIAITYTAETIDPNGDGEQSNSRSRSRNRPKSDSAQPKDGNIWSFLLASTSCTAGGLLLVHQLLMSNDSSFSLSPEQLCPIQRQFLRCPLSTCAVSFNTSSFPAERHSNILMVLPDLECIKVYQVFSRTSHNRGRRNSSATVDSSTSSSRLIRGINAQNGKFLITLYPGYVKSSESDAVVRRKRVLDAAWVLGGRAVLALLEDGEWGVWDIEAAGPSSSATTHNLVKGQTHVSGIQGGASTKFSFKSKIVPTLDRVPKSASENSRQSKAGDLVPMTPHTRKVRSEGLFQGISHTSPIQPNLGRFVCGSVYVTRHTSKTMSTAPKQPDESVVLSYESTSVFIFSLLGFWRAETTGRGSFESSKSSRPVALPALQLGGERQKAIAILSEPRASSLGNLFETTRPLPNFIITTDHRLIMVVSPVSEPPSSDAESALTRQVGANIVNDQLLLNQGELDVDGMDRILDGMTNGGPKSTHGFGKSVLFQLDDDNDVEMGTPTPKNQTKLGPSRGRGGGRGRLFT